MPDDITTQLEIPDSELRGFDNLLSEIAKHTNKQPPDLVAQASRFFLQSAGKATPKGKNRRKLERNPQRTGRGRNASGKKWRYRVYSQRQEPRWVYTDIAGQKNNPGTLISRAGLAKLSWRIMISKVSPSSPKLTGTKNAIGDAGKQTRTTVVTRPEEARAVMRNKLGYIGIIRPNVMDVAMRKSFNRMNKLLTKLSEDYKFKWRT